MWHAFDEYSVQYGLFFQLNFFATIHVDGVVHLGWL